MAVSIADVEAGFPSWSRNQTRRAELQPQWLRETAPDGELALQLDRGRWHVMREYRAVRQDVTMIYGGNAV